MRLLIAGAGGKMGRQFVLQAVERGLAQLVVGDARDPALVDRAMAGQDAVVDTIGTRQPYRRTTLETDAARALVEAARRHGVARVAAISSLGVGDSIANVNFLFRMLLPLFFRGVMPDKEGMEATIQGSGLDWLIVRPSGLTDRRGTGQVRLVTPGSGERAHQVARADVAAWTLEALSASAPLRRIVGLTTT
jgi:uncharacterized protein YbjT (DUF2867 family)